MESIDESQQGYPEEAPPGTDPGADPPSEDTPQRQGGRARREHGEATEQGREGPATGNPHDAGE
jgi:hypothetical protein